MSGLNAQRVVRVPASLAGLAAALLLCASLCAALPATAGAYATVGPVPVAGSPGLPDGRVYEEVSPPNKNGNAAAEPVGDEGKPPTMFAEPGGDGVAYSNDGGSIGDSQSGAQFMTVAKRGSEAWASYGAFPRTIGTSALLDLAPKELGFSADLSKVYFWAKDFFLPEAPPNVALLYDIPQASTTWIDPPPATTEGDGEFAVMAGFSASMATFYFRTETGFYEWHEGRLSVAGVLPDGSVEPKALAAGLPEEAQGKGVTFQSSELRNQVSEDGDDAFFVSSSRNPQLYVRETAADGSQSTVLVSRDTLLPDVGTLPAPSPHGVASITIPHEYSGLFDEQVGGVEGGVSSSYVYASPDGSRAFFASEDRLTSAAPRGGGMYEFDTVTDALTYLPGVGASPILTSSKDGSRFIFNGPAGLSLWSEEGAGGAIQPIESYPVGGEVRATPDGAVFAFETAAPFPGFNNGAPSAKQEIYRYDVAENSLACVSCPPQGVVPSGSAHLTYDIWGLDEAVGQSSLFFSARGISENGSRVFFDSSDPLVPQDANPGVLNVYEWENGRTFLISTGTSKENAYIGDESANGNDVFFSTNQGLAPGDLDEAYDVYDARVPRPGDHPSPPPAACEGDVCQGPPSVPNLLGAPASATFTGLGNPAPPPNVAMAVKPKPKPKARGCMKGFVKRNGRCVKNKTKKLSARKPARGRK